MTAPSDRSLISSIAANERWSRADEDARRAGTEAARSAYSKTFEEQVDPDGVLDPLERARRAKNARRAHMLRLSRASSQARRERKLAALEQQALLDQEAMQSVCLHFWPDELTDEATCPDCGLAYGSWSEKLGGAA